jgi:hypothetical protein
VLERLGSYLDSKQGRAVRIFVVLLVVIVILSASLAYHLLDLGSLFDSPYPSEATPLSLDGDSVKWAYQGIAWFSGYTINYTNMSLWWGGFQGDGCSWSYGLRPANFQAHGADTLSEGVQTTLVIDLGEYCQVRLTDVAGNGIFDSGDYIVFDYGIESISEDNVFVLALACVIYPEWNEEYSFAVNDGRLYAWRSYSLNTHDPWWE